MVSLFAHCLSSIILFPIFGGLYTCCTFSSDCSSTFFCILVDLSSCRPFQIPVDVFARHPSSNNPFLLSRQLFWSPLATVTFSVTHCPMVSPFTRCLSFDEPFYKPQFIDESASFSGHPLPLFKWPPSL